MICACGNGDSESTSESEETQTVEVQRGNLTTTVSAFGNVSMPHRANLSFGVGGTVEELNMDFGDVVKEGDVLAKLEAASLARAVARAQADLRTMEINLERASSDISLLQAEAVVENAQTTLASAEEALEHAQNFNLSDAQTNLENAQRSLASAQKNAELSITAAEEQLEDARDVWEDFVQANIDTLTTIYNSIQEKDLRENVEDAEKHLEVVEETAVTSIATAETTLSAAGRALSNTPVEVQQKEAAVASAKAVLAQAENDLAYVQAGMDIELIQINVDKALIAMEEAQDRLDDATIIAPFDGTIADVNVLVGDEVMANTIVMHLVDTSEVEIDADVDEIDVAKVEIGQEAEISIDAVPGVEFSGEVTAVTPVGRNQAGLITYDITIGIKDTQRANLKDGMTASSDVIALLAENVLLIPKAAIDKDRATGIQTVMVLTDSGQKEQREVKTGASSGKLTEIISGLEEGEHIISSVSIDISKGSQSQGSTDNAGSEDVDIMECMDKLPDLMPCFEELAKMGEEMGMAPNEYSGEIPWDEIEYWVNDDTGEVSKDVKKCLNTMLENRGCIEALIQMAEEMGIDTSSYSPGDWGGGMGGM
jgi:HlyD family secretion protein